VASAHTELFDFSGLRFSDEPYRHLRAPRALDERLSQELLEWFDSGAPWKLHGEPGFYEVWELDLRRIALPEPLESLVAHGTTEALRCRMECAFGVPLGTRVDVMAHKLGSGQRIRVHNDHGDTEQSLRLLFQVNRGWAPENGGILLLMERDDRASLGPRDCAYLPLHRAAFGFRVSPGSYHAVTRCLAEGRYTLCYSFYDA
jgi:hypothetical protein